MICLAFSNGCMLFCRQSVSCCCLQCHCKFCKVQLVLSVLLNSEDMHAASCCRSVNLERIEQQNGKQVSNELCERDPQLPQGFAPLKDNILIRPGDTLKATCMFDSSAVHSPVNAGATHTDEMCNLYLMLYSQLPFFMACYGSPQVDRHGMGGIPPAGRLEVLSACLCLPISCGSGTYACPALTLMADVMRPQDMLCGAHVVTLCCCEIGRKFLVHSH